MLNTPVIYGLVFTSHSSFCLRVRKAPNSVVFQFLNAFCLSFLLLKLFIWSFVIVDPDTDKWMS